MKKVTALLLALAFILGVVGIGMAHPLKGTVTKIDGKKVTLEVTVEVKDIGGAKVGDEVEIKDGIVKIAKKAVEKKPEPKKNPAAGY